MLPDSFIPFPASALDGEGWMWNIPRRLPIPHKGAQTLQRMKCSAVAGGSGHRALGPARKKRGWDESGGTVPPALSMQEVCTTTRFGTLAAVGAASLKFLFERIAR
jgi:hypothetical protein